ncbi:MAG: right-handed parallel beta-helix repeat-containing protein, partial [bacterium]|nr:right-handed parallel beta-helix repeat-containing protein [bacterium]
MKVRISHCLLFLLFGIFLCPLAWSAEFFVSVDGHDSQPGTREAPFATVAQAQQAARSLQTEAVTVTLHGGVYYLPEPLRFTPADSGSQQAPVIYQAVPNETVVLSGGLRLQLQWQPYRDGIWMASVSPSLAIDQLFLDGQRLPMARYPNFDPSVRVFNGYDRDCFAPQRAVRWANPTGGFIHAMHKHEWGDIHYVITGKDPDNQVQFEGGWQNNRPYGMHDQHRFVENIFEELDAPGEWFYDKSKSILYVLPPHGLDLTTAKVEIVRLKELVHLQGTPSQPVQWITLRGLTFRHAARTFMDNKEPLLRSDWTVYRGGAVFFQGAQHCTIEDCVFDQLGGNTIFVNNWNRAITIRGCDIHESGANGIAFVGHPDAVRNPLFKYEERQSLAEIDLTPGPRSDDYPRDCLVEDCLITRTGRVEKQTAPVQISMAFAITVRHCSIYEVPRAGINISEGTFGGHVIEYCDVFDTVLETGDHGSFNSWGRDRFWGLENTPPSRLPELAKLDMLQPNILRHNRWRCDHGWDIDLDDGSSNYEIYNNLLLNGGLKLREGFHRTVYNNITVNNTLHPHVWYEESQDIVKHNLFMAAYRPAGGMPKGRWGRQIDRNLFTTSEADRTAFASHGCDPSSIVANPMFLDPARADYRVHPDSPALSLGFQNFPMDQFGVQKPSLKARARQPVFPAIKGSISAPSPALPVYQWQGMLLRDLTGEAFSAFGVSKESGGIQVFALTDAATAPLRQNDLIQGINSDPVRNIAELLHRLASLTP